MRKSLLVPLAIAVILLTGVRITNAETATGSYSRCMNDAALEANSCYQNADGYWQNKSCDWAWDINRAACLRSLVHAVAG